MATERKKFIKSEIPMLSREIELYGNSLSNFDNKTIKLDLTSELRGKGAELRLILKSEDNVSKAYPIELTLMGSYIRRMMRKGSDYVEDSFEAETKDFKVRIKPFLITRKKVSKSVRTALRNSAKEQITEYLKLKTFENIVLDLINNKLQKEIIVKLKKIYPLALCEIKSIYILKNEMSKIGKSK
ncbi:MAG TPA: hypothetical protein VI815_02185 [Candidatus Nanoarchaeia archaeon]|nr:hypothetical protein [Candidatus Nanoarchaeia archaeon]